MARNRAARNKRARMMMKMAVIQMGMLLKKKTAGSHLLMKLTRRCSRKLRRNHRIN